MEISLTDRPKLHGHGTVDMGIHPTLVRFLEDTLSATFTTLETGCGLSTVTFLNAGVRQHVAVCPAPEEFQAVRDACVARGISTAALTAIAERSEDYLPEADTSSLDLVLIDGEHAFPIPFVDWQYTADRLRVGGYMVVDDLQIPTGMFLADFMDADPRWTRVLRTDRFSVHQKVGQPIGGLNWTAQPYLTARSPAASLRVELFVEPPGPGRFERAMARVLPWRLMQKPLLARFGWPRRD
jgi:hypothetical protein